MSRRAGFDVLRCASVLMVMLYHSTFIGPRVYDAFVARGFVFSHQIGAGLLLVLSAFFVAATLGRRGSASTGRWWWSKIARLLPPFVAATVVAWTALRFLAPAGMYHPTVYELFTNLIMLWDWNGVRHWDYVDGSYWTIPLQLMAFTVAALIRRTPLGRGRGLRAVMWVAVVLPLARWPLEQAGGPLVTSIVDGFGLYRWHLFVAGVAAWMAATGRLRHGHAAALLLTCVAAHAVQIGESAPDGTFTTDPWSVAGVGVGVLVLTLVASGRDAAALLPAVVTRPLAWLAGISYGVFLVHQTLGYVLMLRLQEAFGLGPGLQTVAMLVNGVLLGWLLTRYVERPARRRLLRAWDRRTASAPVPVTTTHLPVPTGTPRPVPVAA